MIEVSSSAGWLREGGKEQGKEGAREGVEGIVCVDF